MFDLMPGWMYRVANALVRRYQATQIQKVKESLQSCGKDVYISPESLIWGVGGVCLGNQVVINSFTHIFGSGGVSIGDRTMISTQCSIASVTHPEAVANRTTLIEQKVSIGSDCWIGTGAIILPGVSIGEGTIIGAGSVVTRDIPSHSVAIGVPARVVRTLDQVNVEKR